MDKKVQQINFLKISNFLLSARCMKLYNIARSKRRLKQKEISICSKLHKENNKNTKNIFKKSFFFSDFTLYKETLYFIMIILSLYLNILTLESIFEYLNTNVKNQKHMLILKFHPRMKCLHVFFSFFDLGKKFYSCFLASDEFIPRYNFIS